MVTKQVCLFKHVEICLYVSPLLDSTFSDPKLDLSPTIDFRNKKYQRDIIKNDVTYKLIEN